ncbi:MAG: hypothetical protein ACM3NQ_15270 [Bacteroidales bacterium]
MRRLLVPLALLLLLIVSACSRPSSDIEKLKRGDSVTVTLKDGTVVAGRFVDVRPDEIVIDPFHGGDWQTVPRAQVASVKQTDAANTGGEAAAESAPSQPAAGGATPAQPGRNTNANKRSDRAASAPGETLRDSEPSAASPAPARPAFEEVTVPANTLLHVRLEHGLASNTSHVEDPVRASITRSLDIDGVEALPAGSEIKGVVTEATPSGKVKGRATLALRFDTLATHGDQYKVRTQGVAREAAGTKKKDAAKIGIPAAGGAIIGGILGGGKGAAIGGAVGGGAGTAVVLSTAGEEVHLPAGTALTVKLLEPVTVRVPVRR